MENINHRNYYIKNAEKKEEAPEVIAEEPVVAPPIMEEVKEEDNTPLYPSTKEGLKDLTKEEQVKILTELGLSRKDIKKLKYEGDRIEKILEIIQ